ncbi:response regulator [Labrenzia sp. PHM005]|uniref:response regulator n=1 Tax=Labrenzia sp. PHM005 TaxID=2590016 RepID=UPI00113FF4F5|nr:response regulator [Labrenzia sp. PHM005]QDG75589.1 response regulator [Labrenzia sp. PHM005]
MLHKIIRVLIADDSSVAREVVAQGVKTHRKERYIEVDVVDNGRAALETLRKKSIDIAFIDINMPGLNGPEVVSAMQETQSNECLTVAMSGSLDDKLEAVLKRFGAYHFLQKPFLPEDVAEIVGTYRMMVHAYPILIVDDSGTMRKITRKVLESSRFNFEISEADSAENALKKLAGREYAIVLTDFHMPGLDGLELAGSIRDLSSKIAIYMMSTNDTTYLERSAAFIGINGFLKKPFNAADIDTLMHEYLEIDKPKFGKVRDMFSFVSRERKAS